MEPVEAEERIVRSVCNEINYSTVQCNAMQLRLHIDMDTSDRVFFVYCSKVVVIHMKCSL